VLKENGSIAKHDGVLGWPVRDPLYLLQRPLILLLIDVVDDHGLVSPHILSKPDALVNLPM
jgi:hypothetical protein